MATYTVQVKETLRRLVKVEAKTYEEAIEKVEDMYDREEIVLDASDFVDNRFEVIEVTE